MNKSIGNAAVPSAMIAALCLLAAVSLLSKTNGGTRSKDMKHICINKYTVSRGDSPWQGMTDSRQQEEANRHIKAVLIEGKGYVIIPHLAKYSIGPDMIMGRNSAKKQVVVNKKYFSSLERGDATRIPPGAGRKIGAAAPSLVASWGAARIAEFLLESQIVETYWHLGAELCLVKEDKDHGVYAAHYTALHRYCTNECVTEQYRFAIKINTKSGEMLLTGTSMKE